MCDRFKSSVTSRCYLVVWCGVACCWAATTTFLRPNLRGCSDNPAIYNHDWPLPSQLASWQALPLWFTLATGEASIDQLELTAPKTKYVNTNNDECNNTSQQALVLAVKFRYCQPIKRQNSTYVRTGQLLQCNFPLPQGLIQVQVPQHILLQVPFFVWRCDTVSKSQHVTHIHTTIQHSDASVLIRVISSVCLTCAYMFAVRVAGERWGVVFVCMDVGKKGEREREKSNRQKVQET